MSIGIITRGTVLEDQPAFFMRRIRSAADVDITQATISTITYVVYDLADDSVVTASTSLTVADVVFDTLQITNAWTSQGGDATGYNFGAELPGTNWPTSGKLLRVEITFTPTSGSAFMVAFDVSVLKIVST